MLYSQNILMVFKGGDGDNVDNRQDNEDVWGEEGHIWVKQVTLKIVWFEP